MDEDAETLSLTCIELLRYSEAFHAYKSARDSKALKPWDGSKVMEAVKQNDFDLAEEDLSEE